MLVFGRNEDAGINMRHFVVRVHDYPPGIIRGRCARGHKKTNVPTDIAHNGSGHDTEEVEWGTLRKEVLSPLGANYEDTMYTPRQCTSALTVMLVEEATQLKYELGRFLRFGLDDNKQWERSGNLGALSQSVRLPCDTSLRVVDIGATGRRAVWLEHDLETTRTRLMKMEMGQVRKDKGVYQGVLLPPDPPLPFRTDSCNMLAFDEATCRVCLGLWDGSIYVLDFQ